jgi:hypothetical protein
MDDQLDQQFILFVMVGKRKKAATLFEHRSLNKPKMLESIIHRNTNTFSTPVCGIFCLINANSKQNTNGLNDHLIITYVQFELNMLTLNRIGEYLKQGSSHKHRLLFTLLFN